jgi:hypothetical protein
VGVGLLLMAGVDGSSNWTAFLPGFIVSGLGIGMTNPPLLSAAVGVVPPEHSGMASGINTTFRQVGIATGVAGLGAVFQSRIDTKLAELMPGAPSGLGEAVASGGVRAAQGAAPPGSRAEIAADAKIAFAGALNDILLIGAVIAFIGAALAFVLVRERDFVVSPRAEAAQPDEAAEPVTA